MKRILAGLMCWMGFMVMPAVATTVEQWGVFEISLEGPETGNPFVEVQFGARFTDGHGSVAVRGFYDGEGVYRVRFMPPRVGQWRYVTESNRWELTNHQGSVDVVVPGPGNHGKVKVYQDYHFIYEDGTPYRPIGTTIYSWLNRPA
ncbi:MAG: hypothetical protein RL648_1038, partial [Verrucomicrobiota bacterium]